MPEMRSQMAKVEIHPVAESKLRTVRNALVAIPQSVTTAVPLVPKASNRFASYMKVVKQGASAGDTLGTGYNWVRVITGYELLGISLRQRSQRLCLLAGIT